jgi:hypothetical protein
MQYNKLPCIKIQHSTSGAQQRKAQKSTVQKRTDLVENTYKAYMSWPNLKYFIANSNMEYRPSCNDEVE